MVLKIYDTWCLFVSPVILNIPDIPDIPDILEFPIFLKLRTFPIYFHAKFGAPNLKNGGVITNLLKIWNCNNAAIFEARTSRFCMVGYLGNSYRNSGNTGISGMSGMLRMSWEIACHQVSYIFWTTSLRWFEWWWEFQEWSGFRECQECWEF